METALNMGGEPGLGFGNAPSMIGDFFAGTPSQPVHLLSPNVSGSVVSFVVFNAPPGTSVLPNAAPSNTNDPASFNIQVADFYVNKFGSLPTGYSTPTGGINVLTVAPYSAVPSVLSVSTLTSPPPNPGYTSNLLPNVPYGGSYPLQATPGTVLNVIVQPNQLTPLQNIVTQVNASPQAVAVGFNRYVAGPTAEGYTSFPQPPGTSSGFVFSSSTGNDAVSLPVNFTHVFTTTLPFAATAGAIKLADNESPLPRDRIIFDYSFFDNTTLAPGGVNVNRFIAGFEKTLFSDNYSVEFKIPFATTFDSNITIDGNAQYGPFGNTALTNQHAVELGNAEVLFKGVLCRSETMVTTGGLGVGLPTASDITVTRSDGTNLYTIENTAPHIMPFIGNVWTPTSRFFLQQMVQLDVEVTGNEVVINEDPNKQLSSSGTFKDAGRLNDPVFAFYDISAGYWLFHCPECSNRCITGLAGMLELHFNQSLGGFNGVSAPMLDSTGQQQSYWQPNAAIPYYGGSLEPLNLQVGGGGPFTSLDLTAGCTLEIRDNAYLSLGITVPMVGGADREFDYEFRPNFSYYFGRSTKQYRVGVGGAPSTL